MPGRRNTIWNTTAVTGASVGTLVGLVAFSASSQKTLILANPVDDFVIVEIGFGADGATATAPVQVYIYRTTTLGSPAGTTITPTKWDPNQATTGVTALGQLSTEPTTVDAITGWTVPANNGLLVLQYPLGREMVAADGGARIGLLLRVPAGVSGNAMAYMVIEE